MLNNIPELKNKIRYHNPLIKQNYSNVSNDSHLETVLIDFLHKNKYARPNLDIFLKNNKNLLLKYNIDDSVKKYKDFHIKSVPYSIRDFHNILDSIKKEFNLPKCETKTIVNEVKEINKVKELKRSEGTATLKSYAEIKQEKFKQVPVKAPVKAQVQVKVQKSTITNTL